MAGGTRLFQQPRSPLIQGHSKTERPFWQDWLAGLALAGVLALVAMYTTGNLARAKPSGWALLLAAGAIGSAVGIQLARGWGVRFRWLLGALFAVVAGAAGAWAGVLLGVL